MPNILLGCFVAVVSSALQSTGLTLQRKAHLLESSEESGEVPRNAMLLWRIGVLLFVVSNLVGSGIQLVALPLLILCPLQAVGLVFNSLFASLLLGESLNSTSLLGTVLVVVGAGVVAGFGALPEPELSLDELVGRLLRPGFMIWFFFCLAAGAFCGLCASHPRRRLETRGFLYGVLGGILSAHSLLMAKSAVQLLVQTLHHGFKDLFRYQFFLIVLSFATFAILQLYFVNNGLKYTSTSVLYPLVFCVFNLVSMMNALLYFEQFDVLKSYKVIAVVFGTILLLTGVFLLSGRLDSGPYQPEERVQLVQNTRVSEYTSLHSLHPGVANPDGHNSRLTRIRSFRANRKRTLSCEETQILNELAR